MTLKRRLGFQIALMLAGIVMLGAAGLIGVSTLHTDLSFTLRANEQLRHIYTMAARLADARSSTERSDALRGQAAVQLKQTADLFDAFNATANSSWLPGTEVAAAAIRPSLAAAADELQKPEPNSIAVFASPYARFAELIAATRQAVAQRQAVADRKHVVTLAAVGTLSLCVIIAAIVLAIRQYRSVMHPLDAVRLASRRIASGQFTERAPAHGDEEFVALAGDFNRMASDLQALYADLEERIAIKSRELAQSERLASVGFLAAGVAHEINNPLAIIAGHGERSLMRLERGNATDSADKLQDSLRIIRDEAFRCKRITDGLLALARPGDETRGPVRLDQTIREVVSTLSALPRFNDREATLNADDSAELVVIANEARLRQAILNLTVNALEATPPRTGRVRITLRRSASAIECEIADNGCGMNPETIGRAFEPFFTEKRGPSNGNDRAGTGLGLSIVHSIIANLGGTIRAESDGPDRGSRFIFTLPVTEGRETIAAIAP